MRARVGGTRATPFILAAHFAKRNTKFGGGKIGIGKRGRAKIPSPNPLPFCPPERSVSAARSAAINRSFVQNRFELRSAIATKLNFFQIQRRFVARSPRLRRVSLRKKPCISELNRKVGQIQIQFFGKANGGSELRSNSQMKFVSNFFRFCQRQKYKASFLIPRFCAVGAVGWEAFPPFGIKPNIKAKRLSNPFKRKKVARKNKELKRKLFCFARRVSAGGNAGAGFQIIRAIFARKRFELRSVIATNLNSFYARVTGSGDNPPPVIQKSRRQKDKIS